MGIFLCSKHGTISLSPERLCEAQVRSKNFETSPEHVDTRICLRTYCTIDELDQSGTGTSRAGGSLLTTSPRALFSFLESLGKILYLFYDLPLFLFKTRVIRKEIRRLLQWKTMSRPALIISNSFSFYFFLSLALSFSRHL